MAPKINRAGTVVAMIMVCMMDCPLLDSIEVSESASVEAVPEVECASVDSVSVESSEVEEVDVVSSSEGTSV